MVPPASIRISRVRTYSGVICVSLAFVYRTITFFGSTFQLYSTSLPQSRMMILNPKDKSLVWPLSLSLAATQEIDVSFSSSGYLDVSVPRVPLHTLCIHVWILEHYPKQVSPFGNLWIKGCLHLPKAYRSLPRPSSAPSAKAFTLRSY